MSYYGQGEVSADFPGLARRQRQQELPGVKQIYIAGCAGNVTAGNDDRSVGQGDIQFSNSPLVEDRITHDLILHITTYGQEPDPKDWAAADNFRYTLTLRR